MTTASATGNGPRHVSEGLGIGYLFLGLIPGLLQFQLGQRKKAVAALVACTGLYLLGWLLVRDRLFHFALLSSEPGGSWLPARVGIPMTLPEILNLPAHAVFSMLAFGSYYESMRLWRLPREMEDLGGMLTAASGMLAAFFCADAFWLLRWRRDAVEGSTPAPRCNPALAAGVSWLLPGFGHALAGQRNKGLLMGGAVALVFLFGMLASHGHGCDRAIASVWWIGESLFGGGALLSALVTAPLTMTAIPDNLELGTNLCTVAGLMNLVVMVDAFTAAERTSFPVAAGTSFGAAEGKA